MSITGINYDAHYFIINNDPGASSGCEEIRSDKPTRQAGRPSAFSYQLSAES